MFRRAPLLVFLCAWLLASGGHWQLVQAFAWGRMIVAYARTMPLDDAVRLAFTPDNLCGVCELVSAAQQNAGDETLPAGAPLQNKLLLTFQPEPVLIHRASDLVGFAPRKAVPSARGRDAPPLPPPRVRTA